MISKNKLLPRLVIDTNLLIAAYFNKKSASFQILKAAQDKKLIILWTESIKKEGEKILNNIKASKKFREDLKEIFKKENKVQKISKVKIIKEDPADNKFLASALSGQANFIISNDHHLLNLKNFQGIPILTPSQALKKLKI